EEAFRPIGYRIVPRGKLAKVWKKFIVMDPSAEVLSTTTAGTVQTTSAFSLDFTAGDVESTPVGEEPGYWKQVSANKGDGDFNSGAVTPVELRYLSPYCSLFDVTLDNVVIPLIAPSLIGTQLHLVLWNKSAGYPLAELLTTTITETAPCSGVANTIYLT